MGRRKPAAAFSLFSFQDIITSVTAILILVMLLLTIELVSRRRHQAAANPDSTRRQVGATAARLEEIASRLREELAARRSHRPQRTQAAARQQLALVEAQLEAAQRRLEETLRTRETVARLRSAAEADAAAHAADIEKLGRLNGQLEDDRQEADRLETANREEDKRQEKRKQETLDAPRSGTELVFNPPTDSDRRAWLVEVSGDGVTVVLLGGDRNERLGLAASPGSAVGRWVDGLKPDRDYCLLLIRPSADDDLEQDMEQRLKDAGIRFGIDLIGEDQVVRDGSKPPSRAF